ncbi:MAG: exodeoxyribonuclease VII small subunit, partial [Candidatus Nanopelagicales bacterium]
ESLSLWERGEQLAGICQVRLDQARARLDSAAPITANPASASNESASNDD